MYGLPTREVPPPFGTGSPKATTRGLEETPYLGSTRLANLPDEAQFARTRHAATAAALRAIKITGSDPRIPIRPNYHSTGRVPTSGVRRLCPQCSPLRHQHINIPQPERGGNGENSGVVNQWLLRRPVD